MKLIAAADKDMGHWKRWRAFSTHFRRYEEL